MNLGFVSPESTVLPNHSIESFFHNHGNIETGSKLDFFLKTGVIKASDRFVADICIRCMRQEHTYVK